MKKIGVLIIDDSALIREILTNALSKDREIEVVGTAKDPYDAREKIAKFRPDVLTLDLEMPRMDGVEFLRHMMPQFPLPTVMVSALTQKGQKLTLDALEAGAVDFVTKPTMDVARKMEDIMDEIRTKVKMAAKIDVSHWKRKREKKEISPIEDIGFLVGSTDKVIAIGASTGGVEAIFRVLVRLPVNSPGVVIVQHMPPGFTKSYADRMNQQCALNVKEAENGDRVLQGHVLIAPGDKHMSVKRSGGIYIVECKEGEKVCGHCPSVEVLFRSVAKYAGSNAIGVMLTGMGSDGADGMVAMRKAGAATLAQDKESSVVFGMPGEAYKRGGAERLVPLDNIAQTIVQTLKSM